MFQTALYTVICKQYWKWLVFQDFIPNLSITRDNCNLTRNVLPCNYTSYINIINKVFLSWLCQFTWYDFWSSLRSDFTDDCIDQNLSRDKLLHNGVSQNKTDVIQIIEALVARYALSYCQGLPHLNCSYKFLLYPLLWTKQPDAMLWRHGKSVHSALMIKSPSVLPI